MSGPNRRAIQKEETRRAVLDAAREEFERVGFESANLRSIAARAGVSAGTVLHYYGDKRELLHAALFDDLDATWRAALGNLGSGPLENQLSRLTAAVFGYYQARPKLSRTLLKESLFADEPWASKFAAQIASVTVEITRLAARAIERGELREDCNTALLAAAWVSFFHFGQISWAQGAYPTPVSLIDHLVRQHLQGLRPVEKQPSTRRAR
ncbi:TetR/AcrR family transcriptional regulator [Pyxidicoccus fallax]|uniref:TetR/AcrR family transcriptional regulator n=1 Tax=Pyxidicoccus fallax TaxID=394095 RepID=A0A848LSL4_9BACT|nr:TetR/AcrR family transcriptional regulator [Pyxidicoccus fallax]NMO20610.1 TetR/AcrR family transcriptional regulator [Pyxidicoccus fallax]NPC81453.1 TetR/AcrR family transcriptional regulator [Pyxidicoccus fallax]